MDHSRAAEAYRAHPTRESLRVWADALAEAGEPRGEFIQLSVLEAPTPEQAARRARLLKQLGGRLVGPARPFLRGWRFGDDGLVAWAETEAARFVEGFELIADLNPRLQLAVTALRKKPVRAAVAGLPLRRLHYLRLEWNALDDAALAGLAPALVGVRNLSLAFNDLTADGVAHLAPHAGELEYLALGTSTRQMADGGAIGDGWVRCLVEKAGFSALRDVSLFNYQRPPAAALLDALRNKPGLRGVHLGEPLFDLARLEPTPPGAPAEQAGAPQP